MATHLVAKRCDLGSLGVPGPASTPEPPAGGAREGSLMGPGREPTLGAGLRSKSMHTHGALESTRDGPVGGQVVSTSVQAATE